MTEVVTQS